MLDATKAFDRDNNCQLFMLLLERNIPTVVIRLLLLIIIKLKPLITYLLFVFCGSGTNAELVPSQPVGQAAVLVYEAHC